MPPRRQARRSRSEGTRTALTDAVLELLTVRRIDELTVNEIVNVASVSRPTFYAHFDTKYSVVALLIEEVGGSVYDVWRPFLEGSGPIEHELLLEISRDTISIWRQHAALYTATVEGWHTDGEMHDAWNIILERFRVGVLDRVSRLRAIEPLDDMITSALVAMFERCVYLAVSVPDSALGRSDEDLALMLTNIWLRALAV